MYARYGELPPLRVFCGLGAMEECFFCGDAVSAEQMYGVQLAGGGELGAVLGRCGSPSSR